MRAKKRKRPLLNKIAETYDAALLSELSSKIKYVGSPEHKDSPNKITGFAKPRADASICPREISKDVSIVNRWLRKAFERGSIGELWEGGFPRYVWYYDKKSECVFQGRLINKELGHYKGWPLEKWEWPKGIEKRYGKN